MQLVAQLDMGLVKEALNWHKNPITTKINQMVKRIEFYTQSTTNKNKVVRIYFLGVLVYVAYTTDKGWDHIKEAKGSFFYFK